MHNFLNFVLLLAGLIYCAPLAAQNADRPRLHLINASSESLDIFWLKSDSERVSNGSLEPGQSTTITTTLGHRFALVGRDAQVEATVTCETRIQGYRYDPSATDGIPTFYQHVASANGLPVVASSQVNPYAVKEAVYIANQMLAHRPDVLQAMIKSGTRLCIMSYKEFTTDLPEFSHLGEERSPLGGVPARDFWDARARGTGGSETDPYCSCAEENLLGYPGDPYSAECILIHEFAHSIHLRGMLNVDPTFDRRLRSAYDAAMKKGLWKTKYASVNHHEYFAEGVQSWFNNNRTNDHDHNHVDTRIELIDYDPGLAEMCKEVFGETVLEYTKPAQRLIDHLEGYDPSTAPKFTWPERLKTAHDAIRKQPRD